MTRLNSLLPGRRLRKWAGPRPGSPRAGRNPARRLAVETLEDRTTPTRVGVVYASPFASDVKTTLVATGRFTSSDVDLLDANATTPSLAALNNYDSVLVFSDLGYQNPTQLGNNLASYVSGGRGVVTATFNFFGGNGLSLGGAWASGGYSPFDGGGQSQGVPLTLGAVAQPAHPVMTGVANFNGGTSSYHNFVTVAPGASLIASWSNGRPLAAEKAGLGGRVVALNFFPPSSNIRSDFWVASTDGGKLLANAVTYVGRRPPVANAGGPYAVPEGGDVQLSGAGSSADPGASIVKYEWDFDYTGTFAADFTSTTEPTAPYSAAGLDGPGGRTVALRVTDDSGLTSIATAAVSISNVAPVAEPRPYTVFEDQSIAGDLGSAVSDPAGPLDPLTFTLVTGPLYAQEFILHGDGEFLYTPSPDFSGVGADGQEVPDFFTVRVADGDGGEATFVVRVDVIPVNDPPVGAADRYSLDEDTTLTVPAPGVLANDTDVDGDALTAIPVSGPAHGSLTLNPDGSFSYRPADDYFGEDSFTYLPSDETASGPPVTVELTVTPVNDIPVAAADTYAVAEDGALAVPASDGVLRNDTDVDGDGLTAVLVAGPAHGQLVLEATGSFTYTPFADYTGPDSFTYLATDGIATSSLAAVRITVTAVNDAPVAVDDSAAGDEDTQIAGSVLGNDVDADGPALTAAILAGPHHGTVALNADGTFVYTPAADFNGTDAFTYRANDGALDSNEATVSVTVNPVNDAPAAVADSVTTDEDTAASGNVLANDTDIDGDVLTAALVDGPMHGALALRADGSFTYTPDLNFNGPDAFTYEVSDGQGGAARATASITVTPVDDAPVADAGPYRTGPEGSAVTLDGSHSFDVDDTSLTYSWDFGDGTTGTGATAGHAYADNGTYTATLTVTDPSGATGTDTVTVTVANVAPALAVAANQSASEGAATNFDLGSFADPGAADGPWAVVVNWGDGTTDAFAAAAPGPLGTRSHTYADNGAYAVTVTASDKDHAAGSAAFQVAVANVEPVLSVSGAASVAEGSAYSLTLGSVVDPGRDAVTAYTIRWGDGTSDTVAGSPGGLTRTHAYADGAAGGTPRTVTVDLTDDDGPHRAAGSTAVSVANVAPVIDTVATPGDPVAAGSPSRVKVSGTFHDPGTTDTHTAVWNWGDGSTTAAGPGDLAEAGGSGSVAGQHFYTAAGVYAVTLTVTDKDGATVTRTDTNYVVVYDASAGFAAGVGWINSPAGAFAANPGLAGTAFFGFVARYSAGAAVPTGVTEFLFPAAGFEFRSTSYDWLVVSGAKAQYRGSGTVNGTGDYAFMLTVIDGQRAGGGGVDRFRIRIWNKATGQVVYDNQAGAADWADPTAALLGGGIQL